MNWFASLWVRRRAPQPVAAVESAQDLDQLWRTGLWPEMFGCAAERHSSIDIARAYARLAVRFSGHEQALRVLELGREMLNPPATRELYRTARAVRDELLRRRHTAGGTEKDALLWAEIWTPLRERYLGRPVPASVRKALVDDLRKRHRL